MKQYILRHKVAFIIGTFLIIAIACASNYGYEVFSYRNSEIARLEAKSNELQAELDQTNIKSASLETERDDAKLEGAVMANAFLTTSDVLDKLDQLLGKVDSEDQKIIRNLKENALFPNELLPLMNSEYRDWLYSHQQNVAQYKKLISDIEEQMKILNSAMNKRKSSFKPI